MGSYEDGTERRKRLQGRSQLTPPQGNYQSTQSYPSHSLQGQSEAFNMAGIATALPNVNYQNFNDQAAQRYPTNISPPHPLYQPQGMQQYPGLSVINPMYNNVAYNPPLQQQYPAMYAQTPQSQSSHNMMGAGHPMYQQFYNHPAQYGKQNMYLAGPGGVATGQFAGRGQSMTGVQSQAKQMSDYSLASSSSGVMGRAGASSVVRGPPRKPKQSGHAIWIGNLPPHTDLMSLVHHVCKETIGLESLFLIAKSNCAFANYKDEAACSAAQSKIHDSKFHTIRLVSRLRRSSTPNASDPPIPTGPAAHTVPPIARSPSPKMMKEKEEEDRSVEANSGLSDSLTSDSKPTKDRFFVVKSLTIEDLELSVRNGIWATQSHNEKAMNRAFETAENVYLIFSANKSGEYFGFARMASPINDDPAAAIEFAPKAHTTSDPELPKAIYTPATECAPKGRIIDDSARGTIFWEAEREDEDQEEEDIDSGGSVKSGEPGSPTGGSKAWGKPFQVEWMSTARLPFHRTRGLRNPWNSNREVKIARDGTELETVVGRRLIGLFHRVPSPVVQMPITIPTMRPYQ